MQLLLDICMDTPPSFDSFVTGNNAELLGLLDQIAKRSAPERMVYLWGDAAVGKTHLLKALAQYPPVRFIDPDADDALFIHDEDTTLYLLDDCHRLSPDRQVAAFSLFNDIHENEDFLVVSGSAPSSALSVRDDLRSRLSWCINYRVHSLTDEEKIMALKQLTQEKGIPIAADVLPFLITRYPRDMRTLAAILDALDKYALQTQRMVSLSLLREMVHAGELPPPS